MLPATMKRKQKFKNILKATCARCGNCCIEPVPPVTDKDMARLIKATGLPADRIVRMYSSSEIAWESEREGWIRLSYGKRVIGLRRRNDRCLLLTRDLCCSVYQARPMTCRTFPYEVELDQSGNITELDLNTGIKCGQKQGKGVDSRWLQRTARQEQAEDEAYYRKVERWNRQKERGGKLDFLRFLGLSD